jgi:hypothetical protein
MASAVPNRKSRIVQSAIAEKKSPRTPLGIPPPTMSSSILFDSVLNSYTGINFKVPLYTISI